MPKVAIYNIEGQEVGEVDLMDDIFGLKVNEALLHQAVKVQLANNRQGTQSALTRAEVRGGGAKPWRQKGTGRARHGSSRSPIWVKGGVAFAPKPRDYSMKMPRKMKRLALKNALSSKAQNDEIMVLDSINLPEAKTKEMVKVLNNLKVDGKALIVINEKDDKVLRATGNLQKVKLASINTLNVYDILNSDKFIVTKDALSMIEEVYV